MPYFLKTKISLRPLEQSLQSIYGVGKQSAKQGCQLAGVLPSTNAKHLRSFHRRQFKGNFQKISSQLGEDLRYRVNQSLHQLVSLKTYRGMRHRKKLPVRGQRTHTNARTQKGFDRLTSQKKRMT